MHSGSRHCVTGYSDTMTADILFSVLFEEVGLEHKAEFKLTGIVKCYKMCPVLKDSFQKSQKRQLPLPKTAFVIK